MTDQAAGAEWRFPNPATPPGSSAYYAIRFAPAPLRDPLAALFGWRRQVRAILDDVSDPGVARLKLDWWRDELARSATGAPRHPLSQALTPTIAEHALPVAPFLSIAARVEDELRGRRAADDEAQRQGALFELAARCHGTSAAAELDRARRVGGWCGQVRRIRDAGRLLRRSREVLPESRLAAAGLNHEGLVSRAQRPRLPELIRPMAETLAAEQPEDRDLASLPALLRIQARLHAVLLAELARSHYAVTDQRIGLTPLRKLWIAWRAR